MVRILEERIITLPEVIKILEEKSSKFSLSSVEQITLDYARKFSKIGCEKARELFKRLVEMGISERAAAQIVNIMPKHVEELRIILIKEKEFYTLDELSKILAVLDEYREVKEEES